MINKQNRTQIVANFKREIWESKKTFVWTPIVLAALLLLLAAIELSTTNDYQAKRLGDMIQAAQTVEAQASVKKLGFIVVQVITGLFLVVAFLLQLRYFLSCLFDERRDLSIFFWRSMPVSDVQNIAVKFVMGAFVIPIFFIIAAMVAIVIGYVVFLIYASTLLAEGGSIWSLASTFNIVSPIVSVWIGLIPTVLWLFPFYAWLMLASMVAGRAPFLWAFLPIAFLVLAEAVVALGFGTGSMYFSNILKDYFTLSEAQIMGHGISIAIDSELNTFFYSKVVMSKVSVVALAIGAALIYATYWCRVNRSHE
jgi:ABC-2 type transport system permease protein